MLLGLSALQSLSKHYARRKKRLISSRLNIMHQPTCLKGQHKYLPVQTFMSNAGVV